MIAVVLLPEVCSADVVVVVDLHIIKFERGTNFLTFLFLIEFRCLGKMKDQSYIKRAGRYEKTLPGNFEMVRVCVLKIINNFFYKTIYKKCNKKTQ